MLTRRGLLKSLLGATAGATTLGGYAVAVEPGFRLTIREWSVAHSSWPAAVAPLRIAVITDLHAVEPWMPCQRIEHIVERVIALDADIIVLLGDYVSDLRWRTGDVPIAAWCRALQGLNAPLGVHAVLGNHDWWTDPEAVRRGLEDVGIPVLENQAVKIDRAGRRFWLAGLGDQLACPLGRGRYRGVDDLEGTLRPIDDDDPVILLAHEPDIFPRVPRRVALTLSGHTHGGQVYIPFIGRPVVPSAYGERFAYGHVVEDDRHIVISAGLGVSILPVRFMVPPEIAVVTLTSPEGA